MARSKQLHVVNRSFTITAPNDPTDASVDTTIDAALELSRQLGKNIRQGHSFRLIGYGATLRGQNTGDMDTGLAAAVALSYAPVTAHSVKAWNFMFKKWQKQKQLSGRVGRFVRYDDFECSFKPTYQSARTSTIYANGMGDTSDEYINLYGSASSGVHTSLEDAYNSRQLIPQAGTDEFGASMKAPKFNAYFPEERRLLTSAHLSSVATWARFDEVNLTPGVADYLANSDNVHYVGGSSESNMVFFPADNHVSALAGLFHVQAHVLGPDVDTGDIPPTADTLTLEITLVFEGWSPLAEGVTVPRKQMKAPRKTSKKSKRRS